MSKAELIKIPFAVIGGGLVGGWCAREIRRRFPCEDIYVLDRVSRLGDDSSGRNSGVLHAGLYYSEDSLKKNLCMEGREIWGPWLQEKKAFHLQCGKFIFSSIESDETRLSALFEQAKRNGAKVRMATSSELHEMKPWCHVTQAFFSPETSIVDPAQLMRHLELELVSLGVEVLKNHEVKKISRTPQGLRLQVNDFEIEADVVINCAGHNALSLRRELGLFDLENFFVKGQYVRTSKPFYNKSLLYPLPEEDLKGLGVHTCIEPDGGVKFGPNQFDVRELSYQLDELEQSKLKKDVCANFKILVTSLHDDMCGVRTKILKDGRAYSDFWIKGPRDHGIPNYVECCGIESPGLTSAPAIGRMVAQLI